MNEQELEQKIDRLLDRAIARAEKKRRLIQGALLLLAMMILISLYNH